MTRIRFGYIINPSPLTEPMEPQMLDALDPENTEDLIDAYHEGYLTLGSSAGHPFSAGPLADAWSEGRRDAQRDRRRVVVMPLHPEGYFHSRPEAA